MADSPRKKMLVDVAPPNKTAPSPTSRPIIVKHGPMLQDPMVQNTAVVPTAPLSPAAPQDTHGKIIEAPTEVPDPPAVNEPEPDTTPKTVPPPPEPAPAEPETSSVKDTIEPDTEVEQDTEKQKQLHAEQEAAEKFVHINELIEQKKYFVPINAAAKRRNNRLASVGLLVLLVIAAGAAYAYQAGYLKNWL